MATISAFTVGSGRASKAAPARLLARLSERAAPKDASVTHARLAAKAVAASARRAELEVASARRAAHALERRQRVAGAAAKRASELAEAVERRLEHAAEVKQAALSKKKFAGLDAAARAKAVKAHRVGTEQVKAAQLAASLEGAERRHAAFLEERRAKAAAVTEHAAAVAKNVKQRDEELRAARALRMQDKEDAARALRLTQYGMNMSRNIAHTIHVLHTAEAKESYEHALKQYGAARLEANMRRAALNREQRLDEVRSKAHAVVDSAREKVLAAKNQLELSLSLTSSATAIKLARAATRQRLVRAGELGMGEKLSICGEYIVAADGSWRPVPSPVASPASSSGGRSFRSATPTSTLESEWEEVPAPNAGTVAFA